MILLPIGLILFAVLHCKASALPANTYAEVCKVPPDIGQECQDKTIPTKMMYHFHSLKEECVTFQYRGCGGNKNRFETSDECINSCEVDHFVTKNKLNNSTETQHQLSDCQLAPVNGPCRALIPMWYYDPQTKACAYFSYGGCFGNGNMFNTQQECIRFCGNTI